MFCIHACQVLSFLLETPGEAGPGWPRAALVLLRSQGMRQDDPLLNSIGMMPYTSPAEASSPPAGLAELLDILLTAIDVPEVSILRSLYDVHQPLRDAIATGSLRYNQGDIAGCARLYVATALGLVYAQASQGFPGQARALDAIRKGVLEAQGVADPDERAWILRRAFESVLKVEG